MRLKLTRFCLVLCLLLCGVVCYCQDNQRFNDLKKQDNLAEWLYVRIDFVNANPRQQSFLADTRRQMWRQPRNTDEHIAWLTFLTTLGYNKLQNGDILQSINSYEEAYTYFRKFKVVQFDVVEYVLKPLGNNYTRLGDYERAIFIQQKTINAIDSAVESNTVAALYSNIAISFYNIGRYADAEQAVAKGAALAKDAQVKFNLNNTLADILLQRNELKAAETLLTKNIATQKSTNVHTAYGLMGSYTTLGNIHLEQSQLTKAQSEFNIALKLIETFYPGDRLREKAYLIALLGKIDRLQHQPEKALTRFNKALQILRVNTDAALMNIYGENKLVEIFHEKALTYIDLKQSAPALQNMRYALLATDKMRTEFADDKTRERLQRETRDMYEAALSLAYDIANEKPNDKALLLPLLELCEQSRARTLADRITKNNRQFSAGLKDNLNDKKLSIERAIVYNQKLMMTKRDTAVYQKKIAALKFDLALLNKQQRRENSGQVLPAAKLLNSLPDSLHVFEYFLGNDNLYIIHIYKRQVAQVVKLGPAAGIKDKVNTLVNTYYRSGPDAMLNAPKAFYLLSNDIYTTLISSAGAGLKGNDRICIIPDDVLGYLSFDGLITGRNFEPAISLWPFFIKKATLTYAFSLNTLAQNKSNASAKGKFSGLFVTHDSADDKPIIAVKAEADAIGKMVTGDYSYDDDVNNQAFFKAFDQSSVLHISTHAYLSGTDKEPTLDFGNQKLYLFELLGRPQKPNLVVLSACRTGDGLLAKGEGIISLSRGFSAIGTPATVAGLWDVNDDAAAQITAGMYAGMVTGQSTGTALHNAKLNWLNKNQASDALYLPYYWDSLVLMGADEVVPLQSVWDMALVIKTFALIGTVIVLCVALVWWRRKRG